jgi:hypothetical protein
MDAARSKKRVPRNMVGIVQGACTGSEHSQCVALASMAVLLLLALAGVKGDYKPIPVTLSGCRPANSSLWVSFPDEPYMHRYVSTGWAFFTHYTQAQLFSGLVWTPRSR